MCISRNIFIAGDFDLTIDNVHLNNLMQPFDLTTIINAPMFQNQSYNPIYIDNCKVPLNSLNHFKLVYPITISRFQKI